MTKPKQFKRVLIANRGEIAVRIARTLREIGIDPVAVYSTVDRIAPHVRSCDMAFCIGPGPAAESYLDVEKIIAVAKRAKVDAVHPGYGFLSENTDFSQTIEDAGITFIGPSPHAIATMGSKTAAREVMIKAGVPVVPGSEGALDSAEAAAQFAAGAGYPVMLKASAGGGGKGMRLVESAEQMAGAFRSATSEAQNAFGNDEVYVEKAIIKPRHVEIQILSGPDGKAVWLGERECSMQRRHQKVIEESPCSAIDENVRAAMGQVACTAADAVGYVGAGTVEFLLDQNNDFYFLEMNTRLQVEHPVTELCCGLDLVEMQVRVAQGEPLPFDQSGVTRTGHAMEARIYAEDPDRDFMPSPGIIEDLLLPAGQGVRVDAGVAAGMEVTMFYDPMIAKIIVWGPDRERARKRLARALRETAVKGIRTNTRFLRHLIETTAFKTGAYHTGSIAEMMQSSDHKISKELRRVALAAAVVRRFRRDRDNAGQIPGQEQGKSSTWRNQGWRMRGL